MKKLMKITGALVIVYFLFAFIVYPVLDLTPETRIAVTNGPDGKVYVDQQRNTLLPWTYTTLWFTATTDYQKLVKMNKEAGRAVEENADKALKDIVGISGQTNGK
jgi:hypothetical protein